MKKLVRILAAVGLGLSLTTGFAAAETGSLTKTGPESVNDILFDNENDVDLNNNANVQAQVAADQDANTGEAGVKHNTKGGDAMTGDAENENEVEADVDINNKSASKLALENACGCDSDNEASMEYTGPYSENYIEISNDHHVTVNNNTNVDFSSDVDQSAETGDAWVSGNTTGGSAHTGDASNSSSTVFTLSVAN